MLVARSVLAEHFLPHLESHKAHGRRAKLIRHRAFSFYIGTLLVYFALTKIVSVSFPGVLGYASNIKPADLLNYTNTERQRKNLGALKLDPVLSKAAEAKAKDMFKNDYWAHVSPQGTEPWYFFTSNGYDYLYAGENLAKNFNDSKSVVKAWMNSESHRENMLNPSYTDIGFAVVNGELDGYETTLVVQFFGKRRASEVIAEVPLDGDTPQVQALTNQPVVEEPPVQVLNIGEAAASDINTSVITVPIININLFTKVFVSVLVAFVALLFGLDLWYSARSGIGDISGSTLAHFVVLLVAFAGIVFVMVPGRVG